MRKLVLLLSSTILAVVLASGWAWAATSTDITEKGVGTTRQTSEEGCQTGGTCTDRVSGSIVGTPIDNPNERRTEEDGRAGLAGVVTSDYAEADVDPEAGTFTVPTTGNIRLNDAEGGRLFLAIKGKTTGDLTGDNATFEGTFTATDGTGQFNDVIGGRGDVEFEVTDTGKRSTFKAFLDGSLKRAEEDASKGSGE
jgi:hypothetical protein